MSGSRKTSNRLYKPVPFQWEDESLCVCEHAHNLHSDDDCNGSCSRSGCKCQKYQAAALKGK